MAEEHVERPEETLESESVGTDAPAEVGELSDEELDRIAEKAS